MDTDTREDPNEPFGVWCDRNEIPEAQRVPLLYWILAASALDEMGRPLTELEESHLMDIFMRAHGCGERPLPS